MAKIVIRDGEPADHPFVKNTIRRELLDYSAYFQHVSHHVISLLMDPVVATQKLLVAMPVDSPTDIIGFILHDAPSVVSFVYVRNEFRRGGVATALASQAGVERGEVACPFLTTKVNGQNLPRLADSKGYKVRFRPFMPLDIAATLYQVTNA